MRFFHFLLIATLFITLAHDANALGFDKDFNINLRALASDTFSLRHATNFGKRYTFPAYGKISAHALYNFNDDTSLGVYTKLLAQSDTYLDCLNQGSWGEEVYAVFSSFVGDFELGQMANAAATLAVVKPYFATWQPLPADLANFIHNPVFAQHKHLKYYDTLTSTIPDADGSALKFSYYTPETAGLSLALSFTPETNANDGMISKFAPYHKESALTFAAYHTFDFGFFQSDSFLSYGHYERSHQDYAGGLSLYRKGWTLFGSYRQTHPLKHPQILEAFHPNALYADGWRHAKAWNAGVGYEFFIWNTTLSYFQSKAVDYTAQTQMFNWHNAFRFSQSHTFYAGLFNASYDTSLQKSNRGWGGYLGFEISFGGK